MGRRHVMALVAAAATLLASLPLISVFDRSTWLVYAAIAITLVVGTAMLVRTLRGPAWAQVLAMMAILLLDLTWTFPSGGELAGIIPTGATFVHFNELLAAAGEQVRDQAVPVPDLDGLLLLSTAGIGLVAMLVDLAAAGIRRPALAGLPMLAIYSVPVAVLPQGVNVVTFVLAAAGYLWLLITDSVDRVRRFGRRFSGEGRDVDVWEPSPLSAAGRRLGVVGLVIAVLVPLAIPGMTSGFLEHFGTGPGGNGAGQGGSGPIATVNLSALLHDSLTNADAFEMVRVRTNDPAPYYLRLGAGEQLTNQGFNAVLPTGGGSTVSRPLREPVAPNMPGVSSGRYKADVEVVNLDLRLAPVYQDLASINGLDSSWFYDEPSGQVFTKRGSVNSRRYSFEYVRVSYTADALRRASSIAGTDVGARGLTNVPIVQEVNTLVGQLTQGKITEYDKVRALYDYFSPANGFTYSLTTKPGDSGNAIVDFLTGKRGFCVQYAAALAWLVRAAGYPARVAFGFTRGAGERNGVYSLTNLNLHAWTEIFFPDFGWVPFDATPPSSIPGSAPSAWAPDASAPVTDNGTQAEPGASAGPGGGAVPGDRNPQLPGEEGGLATTQSSTTSPWWIVVAVAAAVILLLLAPGARRRALRRRRRTRSVGVIDLDPAPGADDGAPEFVTDAAGVGVARRDAHSAWAELLDTMVDFGIPVDPSETPRATADRLSGLAELAPAGRGQASLIARAEERARYARLPLRPGPLDEAVRATRAAFAERATRGQRIVAALFPRSVLSGWRLAWITFVSRNIRAAGRIRDGVLAIDPRRLLARTR